jgi:hypothetical protein
MHRVTIYVTVPSYTYEEHFASSLNLVSDLSAIFLQNSEVKASPITNRGGP